MPVHSLRAAALAAALLPAAWVGAAPLSLDEALALAVQRSQLTRSARAGAQGAAEMARAAGQQPDPMLSVGIDNLPATGPERLSTTAEGMTMTRIGIAQEWVAADKRAAREALAQATASREALMEPVAAAEARLQTAMAYIDAWYASAALALTAQGEKLAREALEAGKGRLASVAGSSAEVLGLASALGRAEDDSAEQRQQRSAAAANLQRWTGRSADDLAEPGEPALPGSDAFVAAHPAVLARRRDIAVAREELELARLNRRPNWTWELSYGQRQRMPDLVSLAVNIPLPVAPAARQDRETAARLAQLDKAEAELAEVQRAAAGEYATLSSDVQRLEERIARTRTTVLLPLQQRSETTLAAYRGNQASLAMWFEARQAELDAQRRLLALQRELARARAQLAFKPIVNGASS